MKKFFGFGSSTPPPPPPPSKPPAPPAAKPGPAPKPDATAAAKPEPPKPQPAPAPPPAAAPAPAEAAAPSIVGRWKDPNSGDITEFHADGSVTENSGGQPIGGRYTLAGGKLKLNLEGVPDELSFPVTIKADTLDMVDSEGTLTRYQRQK